MTTIRNTDLRARLLTWVERQKAKGLVSIRLNIAPGADPERALKEFLDAEDAIEADRLHRCA